jgi:low temperature requirement protein LtrA
VTRGRGNSAQAKLLRERGEGERVTFIELFFDLVYVFAVTGLSELLLHHLTLRGAAQTLLLLVAVWWAWVYTAWATNWFDPDRPAVRLMLVGLMLASLVMSASLPAAFGDRGLAFAGAYVAIQLGRTGFVVAALRAEPGLRRTFQRILAWFVASGVLWLAGGLVHGVARESLWLAAVAVDTVAPAIGFPTPRLGRSTPSEWTIAGAHLAERCQLFLIIALGESILATGATLVSTPLSVGTVTALVVAFAGSVAFWWIYFDRAADVARSVIASADDPGRLGRSAYTYSHVPMVAGIIVAAVGDELTIAHPGGHVTAGVAAAVLAGPVLFLVGHVMFKWVVFRQLAVSRVLGTLALCALAPVAMVVPPLALATMATLVLAAVAASDALDPRGSGREAEARAGQAAAEAPEAQAEVAQAPERVDASEVPDAPET